MIVTSRNERDAVPHIDSLHALDWLNFSLAALLTGSGPFVAVKLADRGWMASDIGLILTAGGLASLFTQVPAGELIDMSRSKRALLGLATGAVILGVLVFGLRPDSPPIFGSAVIPGMAGSILGPGIAAVTLGLVGREALPGRLGRNQRLASLGGLAATAITGIVGYALSIEDIFLVTAASALTQRDSMRPRWHLLGWIR
jgi:MFS family permease